jgi:hypothetical protein
VPDARGRGGTKTCAEQSSTRLPARDRLAGPGGAGRVDLAQRGRSPRAAFGNVGHEKLVGVARFAVDPNHLRNRIVVDLDRAPRNAAGKVEFESDVFILAEGPSRGNGAVFCDVNIAATSWPALLQRWPWRQ